ncbi:hypothetical protein ACFFU8_09285 [Chromobacterium piscinae]|uniref:hypothetical protein n=1 Tax=Chromobacterium piscinae TaxID=686831 RepID=UPI001E5FD680|nr:hypothetical protein [Chromobacterium piscinae]MCD5327903.1 hypothetical protein [Chromobacterium piscinae]
MFRSKSKKFHYSENIKAAILLVVLSFLFCGLGVKGMMQGALWSDLIIGLGGGFGFSAGIVASLRGRRLD